MIKTLSGLLPLAVGLVIVAAAVAFLMDRNQVLATWLLAAFLVGHGVVHMLFLVPRPAATAQGPAWPFDMARSWVISPVGLDGDVVRLVGIGLICVVIGGFALGGLSTIGVLVPTGWWPGLVVASAGVSVALLVLFFDPQLLLGFGIDAVLLALVFGSMWSPVAS